MEITIDILDEYLNKYIPIAYKFSGINKKDLRKKTQIYNRRLNNILSINNPEKVYYEPHCIFDLLLLSENNNIDNKWYKEFLYHIDKIVKRLKNKVDISHHKVLKNTIKQIILSLKEQIDNQKQYLDFFGEIFGLDFFLSQDDKFKLIDIEKKLPNGKSVDFVFKHDDDFLPLYIDFFSIHNINPNKLNTEMEFVKFFEDRFNKKIRG